MITDTVYFMVAGLEFYGAIGRSISRAILVSLTGLFPDLRNSPRLDHRRDGTPPRIVENRRTCFAVFARCRT